MKKNHHSKFIRLLSIFTVCSIAVGLFAFSFSASGLTLGDVNKDGFITAADALLALQQAVGKINITDIQKALCNVDTDHLLSATDALLILQLAVGKIDVFPRKASEEDLYYSSRDFYYNVDGSDFEERNIEDINDTYELIDELGGEYEKSDVETTAQTDDGLLIYDRVSKEAEQLGNLHKYDNAEKVTGTLTVGDIVMNYAVPTDITAYDAVPVEYEIYCTNKIRPIHIGVTAFEEPERYADEKDLYFDCNLPGKVDIELKYEGYVNGQTKNGNAPAWSADFNDTKGNAYPYYEYDGELTYSGTLKASELTWLKFSFKNTGNTILDSEGNGAFCFHPILQKKNENGEYVQIANIDNYMQRLYDYFYPGESGEFWLRFNSDGGGYTPGEYRAVIYSQVRNEREGSAWAANYVGGRNIAVDTFDFVVTENGAMTQPNDIVHEHYGNIPRNQWIGVYEEFLSSYHTLTNVSTLPDHPTKGTIYVQPASFTTTLAIKVMQASKQSAAMARIPVNVETDSISIALNPYNDNYYVKDDGTREPLLATQSMVDMRGNAQMGPDALSTCINDLRNMQEAGINFLNSTSAFSYHPTLYDSFKFMMDAVRTMGTFTFSGIVSYPSNSQLSIDNAFHANGGNFEKTMTPWGLSGFNEANAIMAKYSYLRFGELYFKNVNGTIPLAMEDTWGWMTIDHDWRFGLTNNSAIKQYQDWLAETYNYDIDAVNEKYNSNYGSFEDIDPREDGLYEQAMNAYNFTNTSDGVFQDWNSATIELDIYRTVARTKNYEKVLEMSGIEDGKIAIRSEGMTWLAGGIKADTTNSHYRQIFYEQRRNAAIPEIIEASGTVYGCSNYGDIALTASETYELTKQSTKYGITMLKMSMMPHFRDICINTRFGDSKYVTDYNLKNEDLKGVCVDTMIALFPYMKSIYEGGGIPGTMWQDYYCDGFVTSTQYKELKFYTSKIKEMLSTDEGKKWATDFEQTDRSFESDVLSTWSYDKEYVADVVENTERFCCFTDSYTVK